MYLLHYAGTQPDSGGDGRQLFPGRRGRTAQTVVVADDESVHMKTVHQILLHKAGSIQPAEIPGERYDVKPVDAEIPYQGLLLLQGIEQTESRCILLQDIARMRPECYHGTLLAFFPGRVGVRHELRRRIL